MWKLLTSMISDKIYRHLDTQNLLLWEQKGCGKETRESKDQLIIDKYTMKDCKTRLTNLAMGWVDYREAYDMVPHRWINECLKIFKINEKLRISF